jgi:hypothetical protein
MSRRVPFPVESAPLRRSAANDTFDFPLSADAPAFVPLIDKLIADLEKNEELKAKEAADAGDGGPMDKKMRALYQIAKKIRSNPTVLDKLGPADKETANEIVNASILRLEKGVTAYADAVDANNHDLLVLLKKTKGGRRRGKKSRKTKKTRRITRRR